MYQHVMTMGVGVFQFFSHLIFGPFVQGFSIAFKNCGVCNQSALCSYQACVVCVCFCVVCVYACADVKGDLGSVFCGAQLIR